MILPRALLVALLLSAAPAAGEEAVDCGSLSTQMEMNACAARGRDAADAELNLAWRDLRGRVSERTGAALLKAQRAWIAYRDLACEAEAGQYEDGSIAPLIRATCLERLTRARTRDLRDFGP